MQNKRRVIGLTGGVGSGKSRVLQLLKEEFGAQAIVADEEAHKLMEPGQPGYDAVVDAFGETVLNHDGTFDKKRLSDLIFQNEEARKRMDSMVHPLVWQEIDRKISASQSELIVVEFAIMDFEQRGSYDEMWYVYASEETRIKRLQVGRGYTREQSERIMRNQLSEADYRKRCDRVIDNDGTVDEVRAALSDILKEKGQRI